jgi:hypothetical protein
MSIKVTLCGDTLTLDPLEKTKKRNGKNEHKITWVASDESEAFTWDCIHFDDPEAPIEVEDFKPEDKKVKAKNTIKKDSGTKNWCYYICVSNSDGKRVCNDDSIETGGGRGVIRNIS